MRTQRIALLQPGAKTDQRDARTVGFDEWHGDVPAVQGKTLRTAAESSS